MLKKRYLNIRVTFFAFLGLMIGIIISRLFLDCKIDFASVCLFSFLLLLVCIIFFGYAVFTHKYNITIKVRKNISILIKISTICFIIMYVLGMFISLFPLMKLTSIKTYPNDVFVSGIVSDYVDSEQTYKKFILDDCIIENNGVQHSTDFKICVYTTAYSDVELGSKAKFNCNLNTCDYRNELDFSKLVQNIGYSCFVSFDEIEISDGDKELKDIIKGSSYNILHENLSYDNANICYGVLFGEKQGLSAETTEMFSYAGISHILAVSGLHIGVLVSVLFYLFGKMKKHKISKFLLITFCLFFYAYLCSFTPSVCRASIMAFLSLLCKIKRKQYDILSGLSIAGIIILLVSPMSLFLISFQLSFLCVFAIVALAPSIDRLLTKIRIPAPVSKAFAFSVSTNLVLLPICASVFSRISLLGIFVNLLVLPLFSIVYILLFLILVLSLIFNFISPLLFIPNIFLHLIKVIANFASTMPFGILKLFNIGYWVVFIIIITCLILHFLMINKYFKTALVSILSLVILVTFISYNQVNKYEGDNILLNYQSNSNIVFYVNDNEVTMIGSQIDKYDLDIVMKNNKLRKIDNIIAYDFSLNNLTTLDKICKDYNVSNVYVYNKFTNTELLGKITSIKYCDNVVSLKDCSFELVEYMGDIIAITFANENQDRFIIPLDNLNKNKSIYLSNTYCYVDYWLLSDFNTNILWDDIEYKRIYLQHDKNCNLDDVYIVKDLQSIELCKE